MKTNTILIVIIFLALFTILFNLEEKDLNAKTEKKNTINSSTKIEDFNKTINDDIELTLGARWYDIEVDLEGSANASFGNGFGGPDEQRFGTNLSVQYDEPGFVPGRAVEGGRDDARHQDESADADQGRERARDDAARHVHGSQRGSQIVVRRAVRAPKAPPKRARL